MAKRGRVSRKTYFKFGDSYYIGRDNGDGTVTLFKNTRGATPQEVDRYASLADKFEVLVTEAEFGYF
jgi:hypothetical protein